MLEPARNGFGDFLRSRRDRLTPEQAGLAPGRRRRTQGLRREEVAELAGIGVDWYVRLEQGRMVSPLHHDRRGARQGAAAGPDGARPPASARPSTGARHAFERETVSGAVHQVVRSLAQPAYVTGRRWDVLAWNDAAVALFGDFGAWAPDERNIILFLLTTTDARRLFGAGWSREARRVVAQFRAAYDQWAGDPAFEDLLARARSGCPELERCWKAHDVAEPGSGRKRLHLQDGSIADFAYATFQANDDPRLKLAVYSAA